MSENSVDLDQVKYATAVLTDCLVRTLQQIDPTARRRFLANLEQAQQGLRENPTSRPTSEDQTKHENELLVWTKSLISGSEPATARGVPFLDL